MITVTTHLGPIGHASGVYNGSCVTPNGPSDLGIMDYFIDLGDLPAFVEAPGTPVLRRQGVL